MRQRELVVAPSFPLHCPLLQRCSSAQCAHDFNSQVAPMDVSALVVHGNPSLESALLLKSRCLTPSQRKFLCQWGGASVDPPVKQSATPTNR